MKKSTRHDCITAEMLKAGGKVIANALTKISKEIWETKVGLKLH